MHHSLPGQCIILSAADLAVLPERLQWEAFGAYLTDGQLERAEITLSYLTASQLTPLALRARQRLAEARGDTQGALVAIQARAVEFPDAGNQADLIVALVHAGRPGDAESELRRALVRHPADPATLTAAAEVALATGDVTTAREAANRAHLEFPAHLAAQCVVARIEWVAGNHDTAREWLTALLARVANETTSANHLAEVAMVADTVVQPDVASHLRARAAQLRQRRHDATWRSIAAALTDQESERPVLEQSTLKSEPSGQPLRQARTDSSPDGPRPGGEVPSIPDHVMAIVREQFGHDQLRPGQGEVLAQVLAGADTLATMPTGAGKSLCYQVAALARPGTTVVISPLIALMKDQVDSLPPSVAAVSTLVNSTLDASEMRSRLEGIRAGHYKLVYVAPERLRMGGFLSALRAATVGLIVVDEAHCISLWGHDFRPDYLFIPRAAAALGDPPLLALTATATPSLAADIERQMRRPLHRVRTSVFRPNLRYVVQRLDNREAKFAAVLALCRRTTGPGIVYASSREACEQIATVLRREGVQADYYHAGLSREQRAVVQDRFMAGSLRVIVATVAFGMGVDKRNVRFILHFSPPKSLEAYAQESGRAGRDGAAALCALLYSQADLSNLKRWSRTDQVDETLVLAAYRRLAERARVSESRWLIANTATVLADVIDPESDVDQGVIVGLLERAGGLNRHPDAPREIMLRRVASPSSIAALDDALLTLVLAETGLLHSNTATTVAMDRLAEAVDQAPAELERRIDEWAEAGLVIARGHGRETCLELLPPPSDIDRRLRQLLADLRRENERRLRSLINYLEAQSCRHAVLAAHFDEQLAPCGSACDVCSRRARGEPDVPARVVATAAGPKARTITAADAFAIIEAVRTLPFAVGKTGLTRLLSGSVQSSIKADRSSSFGALGHLQVGRIETLVERLIEAGLLHRDESHEYRLLSLTDQGASASLDDLQAVIPGEPAKQPRPSSQNKPTTTSRAANGSSSIDMDQWDASQHQLFERLRHWRTAMATSADLPAYVILHNSALHHLVAVRPTSMAGLADIPGIGSAKVERFGHDLLRILNSPSIEFDA